MFLLCAHGDLDILGRVSRCSCHGCCGSELEEDEVEMNGHVFRWAAMSLYTQG